ncbi:ATP-grasp domain-containing protein [Actinoplanes oblitus]|uniref:ATP-grasp domain-containing protein n=1 Tax=Actinoplanes oblitus TaxID=3040509 RepID=A0ABY8WQA9_9ACTN|nr:ATP-grasp domain-containing protein [Actinoplanes oblitus]WIM99833.1 ATP-grasp domain-containing protein [Actinoplanes oblitus]
MSVVAITVVATSAIRPADLARACDTCRCEPVFLTSAGLMDPAERDEYLAFGPVLEYDPADPGEVVPRLREHRPETILTFSEAAIPATAELAERLGLPYHDRETVTVLTDKWAQRRRLAERGVDAVWSAVVTDSDQARRVLAARPGPVVVKPRRSQSSRDTFLVETGELPPGVRPSPDSPFVIEEFLPGRGGTEFGDYVSVESLVSGGEPVTMGVTGKFPLLPPFREQGQFVPANLGEKEVAAAADLASAAVRALGVRSGLTHTEIKLTPDGPRVIEVNGRIGGFLGDLYQRATGQDLLALGLAAACGRPVTAETPRVTGGVHFQYSNQPPVSGGVLREITGADLVRRESGVAGYTVRFGPGTERPPGVMTFFVDLLRGEAADHQAMLALIDRCLSHLRFTWERPGGTVTDWRAGRDGLYRTPEKGQR